MSAIRQLLEEIWRRPGVICNSHIVWWNRDHGERLTGELCAEVLYAAKGKRMNPDDKARKQQKKRLERA